MTYLKVIALLPIFFFTSCNDNDQSSAKQWYKGNLHTHSYWSDGDEFPEIIMDWYKSRDYQFVALTDHNTLAEGDKWKVISQDSLYQSAFQNYLDKYGESWVSHELDSLNRTRVKLKTYEEYRGEFEEKEKFLIIQSEEITDNFEGKPLHLNATNVRKNIDPQRGNSVVDVLQNNIDEVIKQSDSLDIPMIVHVNHPNFGYAITLEDMIALRNEKYFEVYNGHHMVHNSGDSTHMSTEKMWDYINIAYIDLNLPLMYGLATDDSHNYHVKGKQWSNAGRGWIEVRSASLDPASLIKALEEGDFYASTGVELNELYVDSKKIAIEVKQEVDVNYEITFIGCRKGSAEPEVLMSSQENQATFNLTKDLLFVRAKITSSKLHSNPIEDLLYETAWTQPVLVSSNE